MPQKVVSWFRLWIPFSLHRVDRYFMRSYLKIFLLIIAGLMALITIGDLFQNFDNFMVFGREEDFGLIETLSLSAAYYASFVPQLVFQYMLPLAMLLAAAITATAAHSGPKKNNEYTVLRSVGVPIRRALMPLLIPALVIAVLFQCCRDLFLPGMIRRYNSIFVQLRNRTHPPLSISIVHGNEFQSAAIGFFDSERHAVNIIVDSRNLESYQRGDPARGDNDFVSYRATEAVLEPSPDGQGYQWRPLREGLRQNYGQFARKSEPWTVPLPTGMTPAMLERQTLGDAVCSWSDLWMLHTDDAGARFSLHWRLADPIACALLIAWGLGLVMGQMIRGSRAGYIQALILSMLAAGAFYVLRLTGRGLWESGALSAAAGAWLPMVVAAPFALGILLWMER